MKNQIAWLKGIRQIEIEDAAVPVLKDDEVLIQPHYVGVCGSDVGFFLDPTLNGRFLSNSLSFWAMSAAVLWWIEAKKLQISRWATK